MDVPESVIIVAAITAVPPTIVGTASLISSLRNRDKLVETQKQVELADAKLVIVHELVNSRLTAALDKIDRLELKLQRLTGREPTGEPPPQTGHKPTDLIGRRDTTPVPSE